MLDRDVDAEAKQLALSSLDELTQKPKVFDFLSHRLCAAPLPPLADIETALQLSRSAASVGVTHLLEQVRLLQPFILEARTHWDALTPELFDTDSKETLGRFAVSSGMFFRLAQQLARDERMENHSILGLRSLRKSSRRVCSDPP